jgi:hypothetical protein
MQKIILLLIISCVSSVVYGQADTARKKYNLFNPVPKDKMKEMETDRPDVTESAYTVEAGHFQIESDLFKQTRNKSDGVQSIQNSYNLANLKLGLAEKWDMQLVVPTYVTNTSRDLATGKIIDKTSGVGEISLRFKYNIWGSSGGRTALAVLPYVTFPVSSFNNNGVEAGITFPFALKLGEEWNFGSQASFSISKEDDNKYHPEYLYSFTFGREITKQLSCFVEAYTTYNTYSKIADIYGNGGVVYSITDNLNVDAGLNYGLTKGADKVYFVGFSFRY